jgi:hypothetical protein
MRSVARIGLGAALWLLCVPVVASGQLPPSKPAERLEVPPPPFSDGIFPCSACHVSLKANRARRPLTEMHGDIVLTHDADHRWCLDCHDAENRDLLHLASGEPVPFSESYRLCG